MLDIGWSELVVIGVVALVVVGPKELPTLLRTVGQWVGKARRMAGEFQGQINDAIREAELDDVKKSVDDLRSLSPTRLLTDQLGSLTDDIKRVGSATEDEMGRIEAGLASPFSAPDGAGSALSAFTEASDVAPMSSTDVEGLINAAGTPVADLPPPVFDLTPAPPLAAVTEVADAADAAPTAENPAPEADKKATGA